MIDWYMFSIYLSIVTSVEIGIFILIEAWQLKELIKTGKQTNLVLRQLSTDPDIAGAILRNGVLGMAREIKQNPEMGTAFFEFISAITFQAVDRARSYFDENQEELSEYTTEIIHLALQEMRENKELQEEFFVFCNYAGIAAYSGIEKKFENQSKDLAKKVKDTIDKEIPVPKKYRWIAEKVDEFLDKKAKTPGVIDDNGGSVKPGGWQ